jgi:hypothetical protein
MMSLSIAKLIPTHNRLRSEKSFYYFLHRFFEQDGDTYGWGNRKVSVVHTEDDLYYLWDGHHIISAAHWAGHETIPASNYTITEMTYKKVMSINFDKGYVTPFNLQTECRLSDFINFKKKILSEIEPNVYDINLEIDILLNAKHYKEPRRAYNIEELINASGLSNIK